LIGAADDAIVVVRPISRVHAARSAEEDDMIHGLQVTMTGVELKRRLADRIAIYEDRIRTLDARIAARAGDCDFDLRASDGDLQTFGQLKGEREHYAYRAATLSLLRDSIVTEESYVLGKTDLRLAELISFDHCDDAEIPIAAIDNPRPATVDGLKLTFRGEELRHCLDERIQVHHARADRWKAELGRTPEDQTEERPLLPSHMCENEAQEETWRAETLTFIREHLEPAAVYRVGEDDLAFAELLPEQPGWLQQLEDEERTGLACQLERLTKRIGARSSGALE
jgi:hypothetical protein